LSLISGLESIEQTRALVSVPVLAGIEASGVANLPSHVGVVIRGAAPAQVKEVLAPGRTVIATTSGGSPTRAADLLAAGATAVLATPASW
jgi:putative N-acetylmannosamine-6-phosphate epimerase